MQNNRLFNLSRWRLASYYAGVMGLILGLCGLAVYEMTSQDHWRSLDQELTSLAGTLHDGLEPLLQQPGQLEPSVKQILPNLCLGTVACPRSPQRRHILNATQQPGYYVRFLDLNGQLLATAGENPPGLAFERETTRQKPLTDQKGNRYHQVSLLLKTTTGEPWGYLKVGRSLVEYDHHLHTIQGFLVWGLPIVMIVVGGASWWLAGLAMEPVYRSYQQIQQFTADIAHELRTPITAIQATLETTLNAEPNAEETHSTLQTLKRQNYRLSHLIHDLLLLSRMDLTTVNPTQFTLCCLNDLVEDLTEEFASLAIAAGVLLSAKLDNQANIWVRGEEEQLYRLVGNLISNAIHYTPTGGEVTVMLETDKQQAIIKVQDTGIGIASENQSRVFDRFYRVDTARSRQRGGAGLGLAIAQAIAVKHQGVLTVESELGQGSLFTIRLSICPPPYQQSRECTKNLT
ncbi:sensory transduction histidine kinase [Synechocystis sp. PCC 6803]|uniref:histidine kinase n=5 Tax=Synechocystis TaxID=1142 RepID=Q55941_SYNY3|nr:MULTISPECIES: two-component system sensor histidine kinase RppB [unclassified Synechocystis]BAM53691.1 sensory transduction histidine kinase [Synechocystis sp. PCC 6803] [Bacillus subtilis BEST7613]AGF52999.1 sensory transduction histidine kinase [Synechocystis sp. PCC 6803]ALJ68891.1 histidine kinase [Synechocystis sp. PCC 6803]AVP90755.1 GHKL domain-containing protein [Synechocystis sp. IPPAS B-1465]QWO80161.1 GHKL domain-containing protein [Synechocystis sp. PCC 6803]